MDERKVLTAREDFSMLELRVILLKYYSAQKGRFRYK